MLFQGREEQSRQRWRRCGRCPAMKTATMVNPQSKTVRSLISALIVLNCGLNTLRRHKMSTTSLQGLLYIRSARSSANFLLGPCAIPETEPTLEDAQHARPESVIFQDPSRRRLLEATTCTLRSFISIEQGHTGHMPRILGITLN